MHNVETEAHVNMLTVVSGKMVGVLTDLENGGDKGRFVTILVDKNDYEAAIGCLSQKMMLIGEPWSDDV